MTLLGGLVGPMDVIVEEGGLGASLAALTVRFVDESEAFAREMAAVGAVASAAQEGVEEIGREMMTAGAMMELGAALDEISWEWISDNHPVLAEAIEEAVEDGVCPEQVRRFVMRRTQRRELALRCEQAARFLEDGMEAS